MQPAIIKQKSIEANTSLVIITNNTSMLHNYGITNDEIEYINLRVSKEQFLININRLSHLINIIITDKNTNEELENLRKFGHNIFKQLKSENHETVCIVDAKESAQHILAVTEGIALSAYSFHYKSEKNKHETTLHTIGISAQSVSDKQVSEINNLIESVYLTRDLVNTPVDRLNATDLANFATELGNKNGFTTKVFNKSKIEALKFGGLLGVNKGSIDPPTFSIMEWKPENAINTKPYVLVGKGVVFDTGGINLKTAPGGLDTMKSDMGGAASVIGTINAIAKNKLPIHIIGLVPATDNRPGENAIVPGDVLTMHNGLTVEVLNTDAEGRLILADALSYANKYEPELVIDLATLTGSAVMAIGEYGTVAMGTADNDTFYHLEENGFATHERIVRFPFWSDYDELIKSDIADIKNLGGREAGAITAGKFLSKFTNFPWIHLDIAGPSFHTSENNYRGKGGSGVGVRLLYSFFKEICRQTLTT